MNNIGIIIFCIGLFLVGMCLGALASALGSKFGKKLAERNEK